MSKVSDSRSTSGEKQDEQDKSDPFLDSDMEVSTFSSLRIRNFRFLLTGTVTSNAAQWVQQVTLSWLIYQLTGSGTMLGSMNLVRSAASMGMIPIAGVMIDRFNRGKLMMSTNGWLFFITLILGIILLVDYSHLSFLFIFSFLAGMTGAVDMSLRQVVIFDLVPRRVAPNAVALVQTGWSLMRSFGPGLGGLLILWVGPGGNFLMQAGAYALITITIMHIQFPGRKTDAFRKSPIENIKEGIRYVVRQPVTRIFMVMGGILPLLIIPIFSILPAIYAADVFHGGAEILGFLMSSVGVGGIVGGLATASLGRVERRGLVQLCSLFMVSLTLIGFAFCKSLWVALPIMALAGFFEMIFLTTNQTLLQLSIPDNIRGRVTSIVNLNLALMPLGGLIAGIGSDLFGGPQVITIVMGGVAASIAVVVFIFSPTVRDYRISAAIKQSQSMSSTDQGR